MNDTLCELMDYFMAQHFISRKYVITLNINQPLPFTFQELLEWIKSRRFQKTLVSLVLNEKELLQVDEHILDENILDENIYLKTIPYHEYFYNVTLENYRKNMINNMRAIYKLDSGLFYNIIGQKLPLWLEHSGAIVLCEVAKYMTNLSGKDEEAKTSSLAKVIRKQIDNYGQLYTYIIQAHDINVKILNDSDLVIIKLELELILNEDYYSTIGELKSQLHFAHTIGSEEQLDNIIQKLGLKLEGDFNYKSHYLSEYIYGMRYSDFV